MVERYMPPDDDPMTDVVEVALHLTTRPGGVELAPLPSEKESQ